MPANGRRDLIRRLKVKVTDSNLNIDRKYSSVLWIGHKITFNRYDFIRSNAVNTPHIKTNINASYRRGSVYWTSFGSIWPHSAVNSWNEDNSIHKWADGYIPRTKNNPHLVNVKNLNKPNPAGAQTKAWVRIPLGAWMFVSCECCVLSGRCLCVGLITHPEESYRV